MYFLFKAPSAPPRNLSGMAVSSSLVTLSWSDPPAIDINGNIAFYFVVVTEAYTGRNLTFHSFARHITVGPLHAYYKYLCMVSVFTTTFGPFTSQISVLSGEACKYLAILEMITGDAKFFLISTCCSTSKFYPE